MEHSAGPSGASERHHDADLCRPVPVPPVYVAIIRRHVEEFGTAPDGRLFQTERGRVLGKSMYSKVWREARQYALTPEQVNSPTAGTPYDLRHAALTLWLNGGVDPPDVAERAGNSVEVLFKWYAQCLYGRRERNNRLIELALEDGESDGPDVTQEPNADAA